MGYLPLRAQSYLDTVIFGNTASESAHAFVGPNTTVFNNTSVSPTQTARRGMTNNPVTVYGGSLTFNLAVDPVRRNYFSIKLWGSDESVGLTQDSDMGRLYLYVPASNFVAGAANNYQVGYRHEGDYAPLNAAGYKPPVAGRFFYSTTLLPLWMTQGRTNLTLTIQPGGRIYDLGSGGPPSGNYQFNMITNSRGIYRAYTHTDPVLNPAGEVQGVAPALTTRPTSGSTTGVATMSSSGAFWNKVNSGFTSLSGKSPTNFSTSDVLNLSLGYWVTNFPSVYSNSSVVTQVVAALDYYASNVYYPNPSGSVNGWGGTFGELGRAIVVLYPKLTNVLDATVDYGVGGVVTRRTAWGDMLLASRDYGRFNRNTLANQNLIANQNIYWANRALLALTNVNAFAEANAQRYLREAIGIEPWLGNDNAAGGHDYNFGTNYFMITPKGLSREWGYVGYGYGEMQVYAANFYEWTTNPVFLAQCVKMAKARAPFRRPAAEVSGSSNYRSMEAVSILSWRGAAESDSQFASEVTYGDRTLYGNGMHCAAVTGDTNLIGYAKQMLNDGQYFCWLQYVGLGADALEAFGDYQTVAAAADSGVRLPFTTNTMPDFAWADEENGIVAVKRGNERLWLSTYWQAGKWTGVNGIGRFLYETNNYDCYGVLEVTPQFTSSGSYVCRPNYVDLTYKTVYAPPDNLTNAYYGERNPIAASDPMVGDNDPFAGKANFWSCRYGHFLIGINRSLATSYELKTPSDFVSATNLITGSVMSGTIMVAPQSTVVLYLNNAASSNPPPVTPLMLNAVGSATPKVDLDWNPASGATGYIVKRATASGGPYTAIASVAGTNFTDTSVTIGGVYYYVIAATNANGASDYNSMEVKVSAGLPSPWQTVCVGAPYLAGGNADYSSGVFSVTGNGSDIGSTSDSFQFVYQPMTSNDGSIMVRLASMASSLGGDKVGIMMRASTNANSMAAFLMFDTSSGFYNVRFACRTGNGSSMNYNWEGPGIAGAPVWFRLQRAGGTTYTASFSSDGTAWTPVGTNTFSMTGTVLAGMVVCARFQSSSFDTSTFDNVSVTGWSSAVPSAPANLIATAGHQSARLRWSAVANAGSYNIKRATLSGGPYVAVGSLATTSFVDGGLTNGATYYYVVNAFNGGESANSSEVSVTPVAATGIGVAISVDFQGGSSGNGTPSVMATTEYAGQVVVNNWNTAVGNSGTLSSLTQSDGTITPVSVSWACNNTWSTPITESPGDYRMMKGYLDSNSTTNTIVTVTNLPSAYTNGYSVYVYCDGDNGAGGKTGNYTIGAKTISATDSANVNFSGTYVQASNSVGNYVVFSNLTASGFTLVASTASTRAPVNAIQIVAGLPAAPTGLAANAGDSQVALSWNPSGGATGYNVKRSLTSGSGYLTVTNIVGTSFTNTGLSNGTTYFFVVSALNTGSESTNSIEVSARPVSLTVPQVQMGIGGGQLQLTWPPANTGWRLLTSTNLSSANWTDVSSNSVMLTNQFSVPIDTTNESVFFRLVYP